MFVSHLENIGLKQALFLLFLGLFCHLETCFLSTPRQMPQTITNILSCLPQIFTVPKFWYHLAHSFSCKKCPFLLRQGFLRGRGRPPKAKRDIFPEKTKLKKWHQNSWHWQKSAQSSGIFVTSRGICQSMGVSSREKVNIFHFWTKMVRKKIKPDLILSNNIDWRRYLEVDGVFAPVQVEETDPGGDASRPFEPEAVARARLEGVDGAVVRSHCQSVTLLQHI